MSRFGFVCWRWQQRHGLSSQQLHVHGRTTSTTCNGKTPKRATAPGHDTVQGQFKPTARPHQTHGRTPYTTTTPIRPHQSYSRTRYRTTADSNDRRYTQPYDISTAHARHAPQALRVCLHLPQLNARRSQLFTAPLLLPLQLAHADVQLRLRLSQRLDAGVRPRELVPKTPVGGS